MKITFVVLHYESLNDTIECLNSLIKYCVNDDINIVVVDNGSKIGKLEAIEKDYNMESIHFLYSKENLGFANGNNLGFRYAKNHLSAEIIVLANNDLIFPQDDFIEKLLSCNDKYQFDVCGPKIISLVDGMNQNPVPVMYKTKMQILKRIIKYIILYLLSFLNTDVLAQNMVAKKITEFLPKQGEDFQLHGACMIFSNNYIRKYNGLYNRTFMYNEESILKEIVNISNMKMFYCPELCVQHKEGASTQAMYGKGVKKRRFYYKWNIKSCFVLMNLKRYGNISDGI